MAGMILLCTSIGPLSGGALEGLLVDTKAPRVAESLAHVADQDILKKHARLKQHGNRALNPLNPVSECFSAGTWKHQTPKIPCHIQQVG